MHATYRVDEFATQLTHVAGTIAWLAGIFPVGACRDETGEKGPRVAVLIPVDFRVPLDPGELSAVAFVSLG